MWVWVRCAKGGRKGSCQGERWKGQASGSGWRVAQSSSQGRAQPVGALSNYWTSAPQDCVCDISCPQWHHRANPSGH